MRITFASEQAAQAAVELWEQHGFGASRAGATVVTDCPTLWAVPVLERSIGLEQVQRLVVHNERTATARPRPKQSAVAAEPDFGRRHTDLAQPAKG